MKKKKKIILTLNKKIKIRKKKSKNSKSKAKKIFIQMPKWKKKLKKSPKIITLDHFLKKWSLKKKFRLKIKKIKIIM